MSEMTSIKKRSKFRRGSAVQERPFDGLFSVIMQEISTLFHETRLLQRPDLMF